MTDRLVESIELATADINEMVTTGKYPIVVLLRGYALLEMLEDSVGTGEMEQVRVVEALKGYRKVYEEHGCELDKLLDREEIKRKAEAYMRPWQRKLEEAEVAYNKSVVLWEAAKEAHRAQEEGGIIERWRTLKIVRKLAGFRLEKGRTGNFVARSFDLMHQAQMVAREAQLELYEHNVEYKCNPDVYGKIYKFICSKNI